MARCVRVALTVRTTDREVRVCPCSSPQVVRGNATLGERSALSPELEVAGELTQKL